MTLTFGPGSAPARAQDSGSLDLGTAVYLGPGVDPTGAAGKGFVVVWREGGALFAREVDAKGASASSPPALVGNFTRFGNPEFSATAAGSDFVVAWHDEYSNEFQYYGPAGEIFARRLRDAEPASEPLVVRSKSTDFDRLIDLKGTDTGQFVVATNSTPRNYYRTGGSAGPSYSITFRNIRGFSPSDVGSGSNTRTASASSMSRAGEGFAVVEFVEYQGPFAQGLTATAADDGPQVALGDGSFLAEAPAEGFLVVWKSPSSAPNRARRLTEDFAVDGREDPGGSLARTLGKIKRRTVGGK
ncbi:MAG: hypothetical protein AAFY88_10060, partial [Acidobacteriota bacterium]